MQAFIKTFEENKKNIEVYSCDNLYDFFISSEEIVHHHDTLNKDTIHKCTKECLPSTKNITQVFGNFEKNKIAGLGLKEIKFNEITAYLSTRHRYIRLEHCRDKKELEQSKKELHHTGMLEFEDQDYGDAAFQLLSALMRKIDHPLLNRYLYIDLCYLPESQWKNRLKINRHFQYSFLFKNDDCAYIFFFSRTKKDIIKINFLELLRKKATELQWVTANNFFFVKKITEFHYTFCINRNIDYDRQIQVEGAFDFQTNQWINYQCNYFNRSSEEKE